MKWYVKIPTHPTDRLNSYIILEVGKGNGWSGGFVRQMEVRPESVIILELEKCYNDFLLGKEELDGDYIYVRAKYHNLKQSRSETLDLTPYRKSE